MTLRRGEGQSSNGPSRQASKRLCLLGSAVALVVAALGAPRLGAAQTAPTWPTFHANGQRSGASAVSGPSNGFVADRFQIPAGVFSSPAVDANGIAYIGDNNGKVYALDYRQYALQPKWVFATSGPVKSSPTLSNDGSMLFVGSDDGHLYGLKTSDGSKVWATLIGGPIEGSPLLSTDGSTLFVASVTGAVAAVTASSGAVKWLQPLGWAVAGSLALSPDGSTLYVASSFNDEMVGMPVSGSGTPTPFYLDAAAVTGPSVDPNGNIYVATRYGELESFTPGNGSPRWTQPYKVINALPILSTPAYAGGQAIFGASDGFVHSIDQSDGNQTWQYQTGGPIDSSPAVATGNNQIYIGSTDGKIYCLTTSGQPCAAKGGFKGFPYSTSTSIDSSPALGPDGSLWVASESGYVYRFVDVSQPGGPPPTSTGTATPPVTSTPTPTSTPTITPTPTTVPLSFSLKGTVAPGGKQTITITSAPNTTVHIRVDYPNGDHQSHGATTNASGRATYTYVQGQSKIMHNKFTARVTAKAGGGSAQRTVTHSYRILFGVIDVSAEPRTIRVGQIVDIFVHTSNYTRVSLFLLAPSGRLIRLTGRTGPKGFASFKFKVPAGLTTGSNKKVTALAKLTARPNISTKTTFTAR